MKIRSDFFSLIFVFRLLRRIQREFSSLSLLVLSYLKSSYEIVNSDKIKVGKFEGFNLRYLNLNLDNSSIFSELLLKQANEILAHEFDLLGSGRQLVAYGVDCKGVEGVKYEMQPKLRTDSAGSWLATRVTRVNFTESSRIWTLISSNYRPIDWQLDFKSGFRWSEKTFHKYIKFGHKCGVDVKVPWELSRMQHLPILAFAAILSKSPQEHDFENNRYALEIRNQILDFIATNPPSFGVNWVCSMDVGIRISNILIAYDLVSSAGFNFGPDFDRILCSSVYCHAKHILNNLEWHPYYRANHYLADIVGVLFSAAYLPRNSLTNSWLSFATHELISEVDRQFYIDGSNFEASTSYHRLSSELVVWGLALLDSFDESEIVALSSPYKCPTESSHFNAIPAFKLFNVDGSSNKSPISPDLRLKVFKMGEFTRAISKPNGLIAQFGDNDSGRFFSAGSLEQIRAGGDKKNPKWSLDHSALCELIRAYNYNSFSDFPSYLIHLLSRRVESFKEIDTEKFQLNMQIGDESIWSYYLSLFNTCKKSSTYISVYNIPPCHSSDFDFESFQGMGVYIFRNKNLFLAIRCGDIGLNGLGAHTHCDQLAIELSINGQSIVADPGTYLYTAALGSRNRYRSVTAHHVPRIGNLEPANLQRNCFDLSDLAPGECLYFGKNGFVGRHSGFGSPIYRQIIIFENRIEIRDFSPHGLTLTDPFPSDIHFSQGYGQLMSFVP